MRTPPTPVVIRLLPVLLLALTACDDGTLMGTLALDNLLRLPPPPVDPAWEIRWVLPDGEGLGYPCDLMEAPDIQEGALAAGLLSFELPEMEEPPFWIEVPGTEDADDGFIWALGIFVLVDAGRWTPWDGETAWDSLSVDRGVWGAADTVGLLFADGGTDGDAEEIREALQIAASDDAEPRDGVLWMGILPQIIEPTGTFLGGIYDLDPVEREELDDEGLVVTATEFLSDRSIEVISGDAVGGQRLNPDCE